MEIIKRRNLRCFKVGLLFIGIGLLFISCNQNKNKPDLKVAWMTSWATTGQVVETLIHTDILKDEDLNVEFKSFLFGPPMNEAALTGQVDITIVGDMPAIILLANSDKWSVISKTINFPYGLLVRTDINIDSIEDLTGKTIGVPFGAGPQPTLYHWLEEAGLVIGNTVNVINLTPAEMPEAIKAKRVDAIMIWEPTMTLLEKQGLVKTIKSSVGYGLMCASNKIIEEKPETIEKFIQAWGKAIHYYTNNYYDHANQFYAEDSRYKLELIEDIRVVDSNFFKKDYSEIDIKIRPIDIRKNQIKADFAFDQRLIKNKLDIQSRIIK